MQSPFGPWATSIDVGPNPQLSTFWRRRMTRLVATSRTSSVLSRRHLLCLGGAGALAWAVPTLRGAGRPTVAAQEPDPVAGTKAKDAEGQAMTKFHKVYALQQGQVWKRIPPPFLPARAVYYRVTSPTQADYIPKPPDVMIFLWRAGKLKNWGMSFGGGDLLLPLRALAGVYPEEIEGDRDLIAARVDGDWIFREGAEKKEMVSQLERILNVECGLGVRLSLRDVERKVIVASGRFQLQPGVRRFRIEIYGKTLVTDGTGGGGSGEFDEFLKWVGMFIHRRVIGDVDNPPKDKLGWHYNEKSPFTAAEHDADHDPASVLKHLTEQTGLTFKEEPQSVPVLFVERKK